MSFLKRFFLFGLVGVAGFAVDTAVLYLMRGFVGLYYGRVPSFVAAAFATWVLNRNLTFRDRRSGTSRRSEFAIYIALMLCGGVVNYGVYAGMIYRYDFVYAYPVIGVAVGSLAGMVVNLFSSRFLLFRFDGDSITPSQQARSVKENGARVPEGIESVIATKGRHVR